ncbi:MAG: hypothetical protein PF689_04025 [Deltaproteobacteria bacterium]|jgi:hypothetical protein|nr:hypothetical protein [Deltaproteobacteria bacterium]
MTNTQIKYLSFVLLITGILATAWFSSKQTRTAQAFNLNQNIRNYWSAEMPVYPNVKEIPLSSNMNVSNTKMKMTWFRTNDIPLEVGNHYSSIWENQGHYVTKDVHPQGGKVSALDLKNNLLRQIIMQRKGDKTIVFVSLIMGQLTNLTKNDKEVDSKIIPIYPGSEGITSFGSNDKSGASKVITYINRGRINDNITFYKLEMQNRGYKLNKTNEFGKLATKKFTREVKILIFSKDKEEVTVSISEIENSNRVRVHISRITGKGE